MEPFAIRKLLSSVGKESEVTVSLRKMLHEEDLLKLRLCKREKTVIKKQLVHGICTLCGVNDDLVENVLEEGIPDSRFERPSQLLKMGLYCVNCSSAINKLRFLCNKKAEAENEFGNLVTGIKWTLNVRKRELNDNAALSEGNGEVGFVESQKALEFSDNVVHSTPENEKKEGGSASKEEITCKGGKSKQEVGQFDFTNIDKKYLECEGCNVHFCKFKPGSFQAHVHKKGGGVAFRCKKCSKEYSSYGGLLLHWRLSTCGRKMYPKKLPKLTTWKCYFCQKKVLDFSTMRLHIRKHTKEYVPYKCEREECGGVWFRSLYMIKRHKILAHGSKKEIEKFRTKEGIKIRNHFNNSAARRKCYFCGKVVSKCGTLYQHMRSHTMEKDLSFQCDICSKVLATARSLRMHCATVHGTNQTLKDDFLRKRRDYNKKKCLPHLKCYFCGKQHKRVGHLFNDMRAHLNERELYKCTECKAVFFSLPGLQYHQVFNCGPDNAEKKALRNKRNEKYQEKRVKLMKLKKCEICGKEITVGFMKSHLKVCSGEGEKRKTCKVCGDTFKTVVDARVHFQTKHDSKKCVFACYFCGKSYPNWSSFELHLVRHLKEHLK